MPDRGVSIRGKFVLSKNVWYKTSDRHDVKRGSEPRKTYPEVKLQGRDLVRGLPSSSTLP